MHSWVSSGHPELEIYAQKVGLEMEKMKLNRLKVIKSPINRDFAKLLREYNASWVFDLHSDAPSNLPDYSELIENPFPIARILYGGDVLDPEADVCMPIRNETGKLIQTFLKNKYGTDWAAVPSAFYPIRRNEKLLAFGLIYARPLDVSIDLVKSLAEYLRKGF